MMYLQMPGTRIVYCPSIRWLSPTIYVSELIAAFCFVYGFISPIEWFHYQRSSARLGKFLSLHCLLLPF